MTLPSWKFFLLGACIASSALAAVHERRNALPQGWRVAGPAADETVATFTIALQQKFDGLEKLLLDVSTPGSLNYGKHWTKAQVDQLFHPGDDAVSSVLAWLNGHGIEHYNVDGAFVDFATDIGTANTLLDASYEYYENNGLTKLRTEEYSVPDALQNRIAAIVPGTYLGNSKKFIPMPGTEMSTRTAVKRDMASNSTVDPSCQRFITPACLRQLYNVGDYAADPKSGSRVGFGSFLNQSALHSDLFLYEDMNKIPRQDFTSVSIANGTLTQDGSLGGYDESNLDVQNIIGVAPSLPVIQYATGGSPPFIPTLGQQTDADNGNEPYVPYYRYLLSQENADLPQVISNSYGDQEDGVPYNYATLTCNLIGLLGLRGITTLFSSGDGGLGGSCIGPDFKTVEFGSDFPGTCPYLTAVGGTVGVAPEVAWNYSTGGFSKYFARPPWQDAAVGTYLREHVSNATYAYYAPYTNFTGGRATPDIAAHSLSPDFQVVYNGRPSASGGTSAAAPVWGAIVGLLNDARLRAGKPVLGFLNPLLYALGNKDGALVDVTEGYTVGCMGTARGSGAVPGARWNATQGWDPTTGYGIPDFQRLKEAVLKI